MAWEQVLHTKITGLGSESAGLVLRLLENSGETTVQASDEKLPWILMGIGLVLALGIVGVVLATKKRGPLSVEGAYEEDWEETEEPEENSEDFVPQNLFDEEPPDHLPFGNEAYPTGPTNRYTAGRFGGPQLLPRHPSLRPDGRPVRLRRGSLYTAPKTPRPSSGIPVYFESADPRAPVQHYEHSTPEKDATRTEVIRLIDILNEVDERNKDK